jgi:uncharacterized protein YecT (DUF1311 family)
MLFLLISILFLSEGQCSNSKQIIELHPIEKIAQNMDCLNKTTVDARVCCQKVYSLWDTELNKIYKELLGSIKDKNAKKSLIESQKKWIQFRDKEFDFYNNYYDLNGTIWGNIELQSKIAFIKSRVKTLYEILKSIDLSSSGNEKLLFE